MTFRFCSTIRLLSLIGLLSVLSAPAVTSAASSVPAQCLAPIKGDEHDPAVRDLHLTIASPTFIGAILCVASNNANGFSRLVATVNIFQSNGTLLTSGGGAVENVAPVLGGSPDNPKVIWPMTTGIGIDAKYSGNLLSQALVVLSWTPCQSALPACNAGPQQTTSFLVPVAFDKPSVAKARKKGS